MSTDIYRFTALHARIDRAIRDELKGRGPDGFRLFRLRRLRQAVKARLTHLFRSGLRAAPFG
jgi:hypothetical protein